MTIQTVKHTVHGRPDQAPTLHVVDNDDRLTWWDLMSDLDPGWLVWTHPPNEGRPPFLHIA